MTRRCYTALICGCTAVFTALCIGSRALLILGLLPLLLIPFGWLSARMVWKTLRIHNNRAGTAVCRGDDVEVEVVFTHGGLLPVAPLRVTMITGQNAKPTVYEAAVRLGKPVRITLPFHAAHIGTCTPGVQSCEVSDLFGFFSKKLTSYDAGQELLVLPCTFEV